MVPPWYDQKFSGRRRCQSSHNLSTICGSRQHFLSQGACSATYRMMKKEQRIYDDVPTVRGGTSEETRGDKPLGVHFGPLTQLGPALNGHRPNISLSQEVSDPGQQNRYGRDNAPPNNLVDRSMRTITSFEDFLEPEEVPWRPVNHGINTL